MKKNNVAIRKIVVSQRCIESQVNGSKVRDGGQVKKLG
jgi:hypothetical protein